MAFQRSAATGNRFCPIPTVPYAYQWYCDTVLPDISLYCLYALYSLSSRSRPLLSEYVETFSRPSHVETIFTCEVISIIVGHSIRHGAWLIARGETDPSPPVFLLPPTPKFSQIKSDQLHLLQHPFFSFTNPKPTTVPTTKRDHIGGLLVRVSLILVRPICTPGAF